MLRSIGFLYIIFFIPMHGLSQEEKQVDKLEERLIGVKHVKKTYLGMPTKAFQRLNDLKLKMSIQDQKRCAVFVNNARKKNTAIKDATYLLMFNNCICFL